MFFVAVWANSYAPVSPRFSVPVKSAGRYGAKKRSHGCASVRPPQSAARGFARRRKRFSDHPVGSSGTSGRRMGPTPAWMGRSRPPSATGLPRVSEEGELTDEADCLTCDEASLCEPACSRGSEGSGALGGRSASAARSSESLHIVEKAKPVDLVPPAPGFRAPAGGSGLHQPTLPRSKPKSLGFRSKTFKFRSSSVDSGLYMLENRATTAASGYAMLMPLTLRVMEKIR